MESDLILWAHDLSFTVGDRRILSDVSFEIEEGEFLGLYGPNGSGKTTLFDVISGFLRPNSGSAGTRARILKAGRPDQRYRLGISRSFQNVRLFWGMTVAENIEIATRRWHRETILGGLLFGKRSRLREAECPVSRFLKPYELDTYANSLARELSFGQMKLVEILRTVYSKPKVVLLDEPFAGLDETYRRTVLNLLFTFKNEGGSAFIIEHDLDSARLVCDRLIALENGQIQIEN